MIPGPQWMVSVRAGALDGCHREVNGTGRPFHLKRANSRSQWIEKTKLLPRALPQKASAPVASSVEAHELVKSWDSPLRHQLPGHLLGIATPPLCEQQEATPAPPFRVVRLNWSQEPTSQQAPQLDQRPLRRDHHPLRTCTTLSHHPSRGYIALVRRIRTLILPLHQRRHLPSLFIRLRIVIVSQDCSNLHWTTS